MQPSTQVDPSELIALPALELARRVRERQTSPTAIVEAHLERIDALEPTINAFQVIRRAEALAEAERLDEHPQLTQLPLAGVPVAIKDNVDVAGLPTRHGSGATGTQAAEQDDELVRRLKAAGCVVVGKTKLPELAIWPFTESAAFGDTHNPWDPARTPGGSSGGSAAAVAAGMAALALGSDGGGSIRIPAACCGLYGLKPAPGLVPIAGGGDEHWYGLSSFGPLARTVADAATALDVLASSNAYSDPQPPARRLRIAHSARHPTIGARASTAVREALEEAVSLLAGAGHTTLKARVPYPADLAVRFGTRWLAGIAQDSERLPAAALEPRTRSMARLGRLAQRRVKPVSAGAFARRMDAWFEQYDLLITPTLAHAAVALGKWSGKGWIATALGVSSWLYTTPWNLAGLPAASLPFGLDDHGMPLALQVIGPRGSELTILELSRQLERLRPWRQLAPELA